MIDALSERLDMSEEHCAGTAACHLMPGAMHIQPFRGSFFAAANFIAHNRIENLRAAAGDGAEAGFTQSFQRIVDRHAKDPLSKMPHLDSGKGFDMKIGIKRVKTA